MATIGELLDRLDSQVHDLRWTPQVAVGAHVAGWASLARATGQAITLLPLGGRSDQVKAGIRKVLAPLARAPRQSDDDAVPAPQLVELATTVGAISDSLAGILRWGPRPEQVGRPALQLEAELLAAIHVATRWSQTTIQVGDCEVLRTPIIAMLRDLEIVTEPYALISPLRRASILEDLAFSVPSSPGLDGVVASWAATAKGILDDHYRVSGWAMQAIAGDLALISRAAREFFATADAERAVGWSGTRSATVLGGAALEWQRAAAWPPHLRLAGQNPDLRQASSQLRVGITSMPILKLAQARRVLGLAVPIGAAHAHVMGSLVRKHELWIHAPLLVPKGPYQSGWVREPRWSEEGGPLEAAAEAGHRALDRALSSLGVAEDPDRRPGERPRWDPLPQHGGVVRSAHHDGPAPSCDLGPSPSV